MVLEKKYEEILPNMSLVIKDCFKEKIIDKEKIITRAIKEVDEISKDSFEIYDHRIIRRIISFILRDLNFS